MSLNAYLDTEIRAEACRRRAAQGIDEAAAAAAPPLIDALQDSD